MIYWHLFGFASHLPAIERERNKAVTPNADVSFDFYDLNFESGG